MAVTIAGKPAVETPTETPDKPTPVKQASGEMAAVLAKIKKEKGEGLVFTGKLIPDVQRIPTGLFEFDLATGGGFPQSRLSIVYGPESSGKSNICYLAAAKAQKGPAHCNKVVWIDLEGTFDPNWVARFGVNIEELIVVKPGYGEECVDIVDALVRADDVALIVLDSIAVVTSSKEAEQSTEKFDVGTAAVLVKRLSNKLAIAFSLEARRGHRPAVIFINQTRFKIGVMFGDPETMPGGQTMKFLSSLTVRLYGKNKVIKEFHPGLPAFKDTTAVIKKAKVPVCMVGFEYNMALIDETNLPIGQSDSWNLVSGHLKSAGLLVKNGTKGWGLFGEVQPTLGVYADRYLQDSGFQQRCQQEVIRLIGGQKVLVEATGLAAK